MAALGLPAFARFAQIGPLAGRVIAGVIMVVAGYQKVNLGPATFGKTLDGLGVPAPVFMGYVVTFTELFGGALLFVGLLTRLAAIPLTIDLIMAIILVNAQHGLVAPMGAMRSRRWR